MALVLTLPRYSNDTPAPIETLEPQTDLVIHVDGSCQPNPGNMFVGVAFFLKDELLWHATEWAGKGTNNQAEYHAFVYAIKALGTLQKKYPEYSLPSTIVSDSRIAVNAFKGIHLPSNPSFGVLFDRFMQSAGRLVHKPTIIWVPRAKNKHADKLSKLLQPGTLAKDALGEKTL